MWQKLLSAILLAVAVLPLQAQSPAGIPSEVAHYPQIVLHNGKLVTMDDASLSPNLGTIVQAMAIRDGKILAVGTNDVVLRLAGPPTRKIDLKGRTVLPGLIDTHDHLHDWVFSHESLTKLVLSDQNVVMRQVQGKTVEEVVQNFVPILRRALDVAQPGEWVEVDLSRGEHDELRQPLVQMINGRREINKELLDKWATQNPVYVHGSGGLAVLLNERAIEELRKAFPPGNGDYEPPENLLQNGIGGVSDNRIMEPEVMFRNRPELLAPLYQKAMEWWAGYGITAWHSNLVASNTLRAYTLLDRKGEMPIRFGWSYRLNVGHYTPYELESLAAMVGKGTPTMWLNGVIVGGVFTCTTLPLPPSEASREKCLFQPGSDGYKAAKDVIKAGIPIRNLHTGPLADKDIDYFLQAIREAAQEANLSDEQVQAQRQAVDHCVNNPRRDQIPLFKKYGIIASCNTLNLFTELPAAVAHYGERYADSFVLRKSLLDGGVMTTSEIDRPIGPTSYNPFFYLTMNLTRKANDGKVYSPAERIDRVSALKTWTIWGAYYLLRDEQLGSLQAGKWADFIILDRDILTVAEQDIPNIRVLATAVGGKFVHVRKEIAAELSESPKGAQALLAP